MTKILFLVFEIYQLDTLVRKVNKIVEINLNSEERVKDQYITFLEEVTKIISKEQKGNALLVNVSVLGCG